MNNQVRRSYLPQKFALKKEHWGFVIFCVVLVVGLVTYELTKPILIEKFTLNGITYKVLQKRQEDETLILKGNDGYKEFLDQEDIAMFKLNTTLVGTFTSNRTTYKIYQNRTIGEEMMTVKGTDGYTAKFQAIGTDAWNQTHHIIYAYIPDPEAIGYMKIVKQWFVAIEK